MTKIHIGSDATFVAVASIPPRIWEQDKALWKAWLASLKAKAATIQQYKRIVTEFYFSMEKPIGECSEADLAFYKRVDGLSLASSTVSRRMRIIRAYWTFAHTKPTQP